MGPSQYVSVNNGAFLCFNCACGIHRHHYGVEVSFIKSIQEDQWNHQQLRALTSSGNKPLREFMDFYDLTYEPVQKRYSTVAMEHYRDKVNNLCLLVQLKAKIDGGAATAIIKPDYEAGKRQATLQTAPQFAMYSHLNSMFS